MNLKITQKFKDQYLKLEAYEKLNIIEELLKLPQKVNNNDFEWEDKVKLTEILKVNLSKEKYSEVFYHLKEETLNEARNQLTYSSETYDQKNFEDIVSSFIEDIKNNLWLNTCLENERELRSNFYSFEKQLRHYSDFYSKKNDSVKEVTKIFKDKILEIEKKVKIYQEDLSFFNKRVEDILKAVLDKNIKKFINFNYEKLDKTLILFILSLILEKFIDRFYEINNEDFLEIYIDDKLKDEIVYVKEESEEDHKTLELEELMN